MTDDGLITQLLNNLDSLSLRDNVVYLDRQDDEPYTIDLDTLDSTIKIEEKMAWLHKNNFEPMQIATLVALAVLNKEQNQ